VPPLAAQVVHGNRHTVGVIVTSTEDNRLLLGTPRSFEQREQVGAHRVDTFG
jgi:hypothetical protein